MSFKRIIYDSGKGREKLRLVSTMIFKIRYLMGPRSETHLGLTKTKTKARLVEQPDSTCLTKTRQTLPRQESLKKPPRKGGPSGTSSPPAGHFTSYENSISYGKFVINKHLEVENPQKRYYQ